MGRLGCQKFLRGSLITPEEYIMMCSSRKVRLIRSPVVGRDR